MMRTTDVVVDVGQHMLRPMASPLCEFVEGFSRRSELGVLDNKWDVGC